MSASTKISPSNACVADLALEGRRHRRGRRARRRDRPHLLGAGTRSDHSGHAACQRRSRPVSAGSPSGSGCSAGCSAGSSSGSPAQRSSSRPSRAIVSALIGNAWGVTTVYSGLAQGLGAELVFAALAYKRFGLVPAIARRCRRRGRRWLLELVRRRATSRRVSSSTRSTSVRCSSRARSSPVSSAGLLVGRSRRPERSVGSRRGGTLGARSDRAGSGCDRSGARRRAGLGLASCRSEGLGGARPRPRDRTGRAGAPARGVRCRQVDAARTRWPACSAATTRGSRTARCSSTAFRPRRARGRVGLVLQDPDSPGRSCPRSATTSPSAARTSASPREEIWRRVGDALDAVGLDLPLDHSTAALSGGQKQRLALAGVLAMRPGLLLLDEPTANLDPAGVAEVRDAVGSRWSSDRRDARGHRAPRRGLARADRPRRRARRRRRCPRRRAARRSCSTHVGAAPRRRGRLGAGHPAAVGPCVRCPAHERRCSDRRPGDRSRRGAAGAGAPRASRCPRARRPSIVGPNGAGKSTLALTLAGLLPEIAGTVDRRSAARRQARASADPLEVHASCSRASARSSRIPSTSSSRRPCANELGVGLLALPLVPDRDRRAGRRAARARCGLASLAEANPFTLSGGAEAPAVGGDRARRPTGGHGPRRADVRAGSTHVAVDSSACCSTSSSAARRSSPSRTTRGSSHISATIASSSNRWNSGGGPHDEPLVQRSARRCCTDRPPLDRVNPVTKVLAVLDPVDPVAADDRLGQCEHARCCSK